MNRHVSPFASLSGAEKQIKWLEYQSIRLPYVQADLSKPKATQASSNEQTQNSTTSSRSEPPERPQPPPEVPRIMPDFQKTKHSQYDAVIARIKQAELQSIVCQTSQIPQQMK